MDFTEELFTLAAIAVEIFAAVYLFAAFVLFSWERSGVRWRAKQFSHSNSIRALPPATQPAIAIEQPTRIRELSVLKATSLV